ncbi:MAG: epoxide hydrolase [Chthonomonadales bacterium]|nr:epoxide hydrolase [Chthonomonadales bacterium]
MAVIMPLRHGVAAPASRERAERTYNVQCWTVLERGSRFPEWKAPVVVAQDIRQFFAELFQLVRRNGLWTQARPD